MNIYDFTVTDNKGNEVPLKAYEGKVLLIVNTATGCGFTPQYEGLQKMYEKFQSRGFEILDFPCNQFLNQAPGSDEKINDFCTLRYNTTFPRFKKIKVNGSEADPLYVYLKESTGGKRIKWNFVKFLIGRDGSIIKRYAPADKPADIEKDAEAIL